jgi:hypothetical protein
MASMTQLFVGDRAGEVASACAVTPTLIADHAIVLTIDRHARESRPTAKFQVFPRLFINPDLLGKPNPFSIPRELP